VISICHRGKDINIIRCVKQSRARAGMSERDMFGVRTREKGWHQMILDNE
jgi:hypothetical protein